MKISRRLKGILASGATIIVGLAVIFSFSVAITHSMESRDLGIIVSVIIGFIGGVPLGQISYGIYRHFVPFRM